MAVKFFDVGLMHCEDVQSEVRSGKFVDAGEYADVEDGAIVNIGALCKDTVYGGAAVDYNCREIEAPASVKVEDVWLVDIDERMFVDAGMGEIFRIGGRTYNLIQKAGFPVRIRKAVKGDIFWLGEGAFDAAPNAGDDVKAVAGQLTYAAGAPAAGEFGLHIEAVEPLTLGARAAKRPDGRYECKYLVSVL